MGKADLHIHTTASDGRMTPENVVQEALKMNLDAIAITDHDTLEGVAPAVEAAVGRELEVLPGIEITSAFNDREAHLLAYDFDMENEDLSLMLRRNQRARVQRAEWIIGQLNKKGLDIDINEVIAEANGLNVGRPHIAEILRKKGYIASIKEAFIRYLSDDALGTIESNYPDFRQIIEIVKAAGGVMVLAHPGRLYSERECRQFAENGIDGVEALHPSHNYTIQKKMEAFAKTYHLLVTGGSDFHGSVKDYYRYFGTLTINRKRVEKIRALSARRKEVSV